MPKIRRHNLPPALYDHLLDRVQQRSISAQQLRLMLRWMDPQPEVPNGRWFSRSTRSPLAVWRSEEKLARRPKHVKLTSMKTLPKMDISDELEAHINEGIRLSELCKSDVVRQALRIGLPQFAARFQPAPLWLEERIREALAEPAKPKTPSQFKREMKAIADGR